MLLAIETIANPWGFAVAGANGLVGDYLIGKAPTETLVEHLRTVLPLWRVSPGQIGAVAVVTGPGHYMGVRGGVTTAKTLAQVWQVPMVALDAAAVIALQAPIGMLVSPVLDVRRNEVYAGLGRRTAAGIVWHQAPAVHAWPVWREVLAAVAGPVCVLGTMTPPMRADAESVVWARVQADAPASRPAVAALEAYRLWRAGGAVSYLDVQPLYVREAVP
ncbi:MAG: tRNA (adenosine(37)-N6)-threonylcarbamoyltransferase complex dimerization subunit type 1 TsaB [Candidatus Sericytochromatia bacterium]|nr:tRNA (adenosine(37)-N6)-threonylcarbamoyltransferase complex dimerization subunit type 1 TsaB [Candidatus Sericytochromatia bacterium]